MLFSWFSICVLYDRSKLLGYQQPFIELELQVHHHLGRVTELRSRHYPIFQGCTSYENTHTAISKTRKYKLGLSVLKWDGLTVIFSGHGLILSLRRQMNNVGI